jgi:adenine-specific DNA-methyltransferase
LAAKKSSGGARKAPSTGRAGAQKATRANRTIDVEDYEHAEAKRTNNPPAGLAHLDREETPTKTLTYDPHLDPQLLWAGKAERAAADVPAPSIHVHEELSAEKIIGSVRRQRTQQALFDVGELDPAKAVEFYRHEMNWSNRMILGDSLVVMSSLLERERMAGKVQCVYIDPPYGIKYQSNFQSNISDRNVRDGNDDDLTREPEMIQAYRDTWELGVHSYLTYLRDRFTVVRELLADSGSVFLQIGEENVHRVRTLLDEIFGAENFISQITFKTTSGSSTSTGLPAVCNHLVWFAKDKSVLKFRQLYLPKAAGRSTDANYSWLELADGSRRRMTADEQRDPATRPGGAKVFRYDNFTSQSGGTTTQFPIELDGKAYLPGKGYWKTNEEGVKRLIEQRRLVGSGKTISYVRYLNDFDGMPLTNVWDDTVQSGFGTDKRYVVQTNTAVIARCVLMTTDPGDLVLDPTCGSGTTAAVSEQYGRRWITVDTSRVALSIARERLLTSTHPYYVLLDQSRDVDGGFAYEQLQRITLKSVAQDEPPDQVVLVDRPVVETRKVRVSGPFTVEALSRYSVNPADDAPAEGPKVFEASDHVEVLLNALRAQGVPRPRTKPAKIESLTPLSTVGVLQAEGVIDRDGKKVKFAVSLGPRFGAITMAQVSDALRDAIGFGMVVFAGFAVSPDAQAQLGSGKVGGVDVALLLANPDLLAGDLLKNTAASQTFRLYASPDVREEQGPDGWRVSVEGVDSFDAATGEVISFGRQGIQAWFLDDAYDGKVFRVSQAFFPVSNGWEKLSKALRGTVDAELVEELHSWTSLPFETPESGRIAVRVIANDGNAAEVIKVLDPKGRKGA